MKYLNTIQKAIIYKITLCLLLLPSLGQADTVKPHVFFLPTLKGHLVGLVDGEGAVLIPPQYKSIEGFGRFNPNIARVQTTDGKFGYISRSGGLIHKPTLDQARLFAEDGFARFQKNGKWGFIGVSGKYLVEPKFDKVGYFSNGFAAVRKEENWSYIDTSGKVVIAGPFSHACPFSVSGLAAVKKRKTANMDLSIPRGNGLSKQSMTEFVLFPREIGRARRSMMNGALSTRRASGLSNRNIMISAGLMNTASQRLSTIIPMEES